MRVLRNIFAGVLAVLSVAVTGYTIRLALGHYASFEEYRAALVGGTSFGATILAIIFVPTMVGTFLVLRFIASRRPLGRPAIVLISMASVVAFELAALALWSGGRIDSWRLDPNEWVTYVSYLVAPGFVFGLIADPGGGVPLSAPADAQGRST
jgi:hypothetical protein